MKQAFKQYRKRLVKYVIAVLLVGFGIGIPGALWSIKMISGNHKNTSQDTTILLKSETRIGAKAAIKTRFTH